MLDKDIIFTWIFTCVCECLYRYKVYLYGCLYIYICLVYFIYILKLLSISYIICFVVYIQYVKYICIYVKAELSYKEY